MASATSVNPLRAPLRRLIAAWTQVRLLEPAPEALGLDPDLTTLYVLPRSSLSDSLLLDVLARQQGLPDATLPSTSRSYPARPALAAHHAAAPLATSPGATLAISSGHRSSPRHRPRYSAGPRQHLLGARAGQAFRTLAATRGRQLAPYRSLRRLLAVMVNGRDLEVHFGAPLRLAELDDGREPSLTDRKAARLLRVHFRRMRSRVLGPDLSHRRTLIEGVARSEPVRRAIEEQAGHSPRQRARLTQRARRYGREIASSMSYPVLRFLDGVLGRLWNRLYDGVDARGLEDVKPLAGECTLVYVLSPQSHRLSAAFLRTLRPGLMPPHIAAGRNLDMPLIGPLLRRGGAFFMRRSFRGKACIRRSSRNTCTACSTEAILWNISSRADDRAAVECCHPAQACWP